MKMNAGTKVVLPGGAGLVGQNLVTALKGKGYVRIVVIDKHPANVAILRRLHADVEVIEADLAFEGAWENAFDGASTVIMLQAQIGGNDPQEFVRNNIDSTVRVLECMRRFNVPQLVHISSSVVESVADDDYTNTKKEQERIVLESGVPAVVLRPTLMFGWFDRKHLGWLSRFMAKVPVFPIPGHGRYMRQPLYAGDFCSIIISCIESGRKEGVYNITGLEQVDYIDIIREIKFATGSGTLILKIPYRLFDVLLRIWAFFDSNPPFTADQLSALIAKDEFEVIDWPGIFSVTPTPFAAAIEKTFNDPQFGRVVLEF